MSMQFRKLMNQLHLAAKTYQLGKVSTYLHRLLQLSKMTEKSLGETISPAETLEANVFWSRVLATRKVSDEVSHKSARSIYAVIWAGANGIPSLAIKDQAGEYCDHIAAACDHYLAASTAEVKPFSAPVAKTAPPHLHLVTSVKT